MAAALAAMNQGLTRLGFDAAARTAITIAQGINNADKLADLLDKNISTMFTVLQKSAGMIPNPAAATAGAPARLPAKIPAPGINIPTLVKGNFKIACYWAWTCTIIQQQVNPALIVMPTIREYKLIQVAEEA